MIWQIAIFHSDPNKNQARTARCNEIETTSDNANGRFSGTRRVLAVVSHQQPCHDLGHYASKQTKRGSFPLRVATNLAKASSTKFQTLWLAQSNRWWERGLKISALKDLSCLCLSHRASTHTASGQSSTECRSASLFGSSNKFTACTAFANIS
eukprot:2890617-Amphidinium_carterae.1